MHLVRTWAFAALCVMASGCGWLFDVAVPCETDAECAAIDPGATCQEGVCTTRALEADALDAQLAQDAALDGAPDDVDADETSLEETTDDPPVDEETDDPPVDEETDDPPVDEGTDDPPQDDWTDDPPQDDWTDDPPPMDELEVIDEGPCDLACLEAAQALVEGLRRDASEVSGRARFITLVSKSDSTVPSGEAWMDAVVQLVRDMRTYEEPGGVGGSSELALTIAFDSEDFFYCHPDTGPAPAVCAEALSLTGVSRHGRAFHYRDGDDASTAQAAMRWLIDPDGVSPKSLVVTGECEAEGWFDLLAFEDAREVVGWLGPTYDCVDELSSASDDPSPSPLAFEVPAPPSPCGLSVPAVDCTGPLLAHTVSLWEPWRVGVDVANPYCGLPWTPEQVWVLPWAHGADAMLPSAGRIACFDEFVSSGIDLTWDPAEASACVLNGGDVRKWLELARFAAGSGQSYVSLSPDPTLVAAFTPEEFWSPPSVAYRTLLRELQARTGLTTKAANAAIDETRAPAPLGVDGSWLIEGDDAAGRPPIYLFLYQERASTTGFFAVFGVGLILDTSRGGFGDLLRTTPIIGVSGTNAPQPGAPEGAEGGLSFSVDPRVELSFAASGPPSDGFVLESALVGELEYRVNEAFSDACDAGDGMDGAGYWTGTLCWRDRDTPDPDDCLHQIQVGPEQRMRFVRLQDL